jgi:hypothetical protein
MRSCSRCGGVVFTGASDCASCGYIFQTGEAPIPVATAAAGFQEPAPEGERSPYRAAGKAVFIVGSGLVIWIPTLLLKGFFGGPWFNGTEVYAAVGPILLVLVSVVARPERGGSKVAFAVAFAPVLMLVGFLSGVMAKEVVFGRSSLVGAFWGPVVASAGWVAIALLYYASLKGESSSRHKELQLPQVHRDA